MVEQPDFSEFGWFLFSSSWLLSLENKFSFITVSSLIIVPCFSQIFLFTYFACKASFVLIEFFCVLWILIFLIFLFHLHLSWKILSFGGVSLKIYRFVSWSVARGSLCLGFPERRKG